MRKHRSTNARLNQPEGTANQCELCDLFGWGGLPEAEGIEAQYHRKGLELGQPERPDFQSMAQNADYIRVATVEGWIRAVGSQRKLLERLGIDPRRLRKIFYPCAMDWDDLPNEPSLVCARQLFPATLKLVEMAELSLRTLQDRSIKFFRIAHRDWVIQAEELLGFSINTLNGQLKEGLSTAVNTPGFLVLVLNCEFDTVGRNFRFHYRGFGDSEKVNALERLRNDEWGYTNDRQTGRPLLTFEEGSAIGTHLLPVFEHLWGCRPIRKVQGEWLPNVRLSHLPEPYDILSSVWLSKLRLQDLRIMLGCRFLECGHLHID